MITKNDLWGEKLLALSWKEPYASLMLCGKIETRTWSTNYRGLVLICCSKTGYSHNSIINISGEKQFERILEAIGKLKTGSYAEFFGFAIAVGRLIDCRPMREDDEDACFVRYNPDLFCHVYEDVVQLYDPLPWRGKQGWSTVSTDFKRLINLRS